MSKIVKGFISICLVFTCSGHLSAAIYQWVDQRGVKHFSDTPKSDKAIKQVIIEPIAVIKTREVVLSIPASNKGYKDRSRRQVADKYCPNLIRSIQRLEKKLTRHHSAARFDELNAQLKRLRWDKMKRC